MKILQRGSKGVQVMFLQRLLNKALARDGVGGAVLKEDGDFGSKTDAAVRAFQTRYKPLVVDGDAGHNTWLALGLRTEKEHNQIRLFGQPTTTSCWSAAATMILGNQSVGQGDANLGSGGGLEGTTENREKFAKSLGWQMLNYSPGVQDLVNLVRRTPAWISAGGSDWGHAVVLSGVYSDGGDEGDGTMFRIHDPWPVGVGKIYGSFSNPLAMYNASGTARIDASLRAVLYPY